MAVGVVAQLAATTLLGNINPEILYSTDLHFARLLVSIVKGLIPILDAC